MQILLAIWIASILFFCFRDIKIGIAIYIPYIFLVPYMSIKFAGLTLSWNLVNTVVFISFLLWKNKKSIQIDWKPLLPFLMLYMYFLIIIPIGDDVPIDVRLNSWRVSFMSTMILPIVMWNVVKNDNSVIRLYRNIAFCSITIAVIYGLLLTQLGGLNPYLQILGDISGSGYNDEYASSSIGEGRLFGRIFSCFGHPMTFALFLGLSFVYLFKNRSTVSKYVFAIMFVLLTIMMFLCGVRSVLGGLAICIAYYFIMGRQYKILFAALIVFIIGYLIILQIPELSSYVGSIADIHNKKSDIGGSSIEMRLDQLQGCLREIRHDPIFGHGYDWHSYYKSIRGDHPVILAFESLIYIILCDYGFVGVIVWIIFSLKVYKNTKKMVGNESVLVCSLFVFYIAYSCITGEYGYMKYFLIFYILMIGETMYERN